MRFQVTFFTAILIFTIFLTACPAPEQPNVNTNSANAANANAPKSNVNSPFNTSKKEAAPTTNNAPTITPVVNAYYEALKKKDDAALKKVLTAEFIKSLEADAKADGKKSIAEYVASIEDLTRTVEVRNEKIEGDTASAEIKGGSYINWTPFEFAKVNGEWKFTGKSPDTKNVREAVSNSNTSK